MNALARYAKGLDARITFAGEVSVNDEGSVRGADFNGVYFAFRRGVLLYVGAGWNVGKRVQAHTSAMRSRRNGWYRRVSPRLKPSSLRWVVAKVRGGHTEALRVEAALIAEHRPPGNFVVPRMPAPDPPEAVTQCMPEPPSWRWVNGPRDEEDDPILQLYERD